MHPDSRTPAHPKASELLWQFLKIGNLTFGGGLPTIFAFEQEFVRVRRWLTPNQFSLCFGLSRITPGTVVLAFVAGAGWHMLGWTGAVIGVFASSVPAAALVVWLTHQYEVLQSNPDAQSVISGLIAAAIGVMAAVALQLMRPGIRRSVWARTLLLALGSTVLMAVFRWNPVPIMLLAAGVGALWPDEREEG